MNAPQLTLKVIVFVHFVLTVWASMNAFLGTAYMYMNIVVLCLGAWSVAQHESPDAVLMFLICHSFSILQDILLLAINAPHAQDVYEQDGVSHREVNTFRFAFGMSITNLIIKPVTAFLLYRIYKERGGTYGDFNIPGVGNLPGFGGSPSHGRNYENIDEPVPSNVPQHEQGQLPAYEPTNQSPYSVEKAPLH